MTPTMTRTERQNRIIGHLAIGPQPDESNSDRLSELNDILNEIAASGDLTALLQIAGMATALAQKVAAGR